jgi:hypothetical protein
LSRAFAPRRIRLEPRGDSGLSRDRAAPTLPAAVTGGTDAKCRPRIDSAIPAGLWKRGFVQALCVGRHAFLSDHLGRLFSELGLMTTCAVGIDGARAAASQCHPDVVICDYDVLATGDITEWETDARLSRIPVLAVSMTRRPHEVHLLDVNGIGGFLYLPGLGTQELRRALTGIRRPAAPPPSFTLPAAVDLTRPASSVR